jgi:pimeloyl-ACP methyl ester carboxylesterase
MSTTGETETEVRPFRIDVPEEEIDELRRRIAATRWPLNVLPQFMTEIDGLDIHFIHVRSPHENALPLVITHGWPGSVVEMLNAVGPLTDPPAHGGGAEDAFHLVIPSMPGYGFSAQGGEHRLGHRPHRTRVGSADEAPRLHEVRRAGPCPIVCT